MLTTGKPALRALDYAGISQLEELTHVTGKEIQALHGIGPKAVEQLRQALADRGYRSPMPSKNDP